jgi:peptide/nickel transport system permease protein
MIPTLIGITMITYFIVRLAPGDPIEAMIRNQSGNIDPKAMKETADKIRDRLGLKEYHYVRDWLFAPAAGDERAGAEKVGAVKAPAEVPGAEKPRAEEVGAAKAPAEVRGAEKPGGTLRWTAEAADKIASAGIGYCVWFGKLCIGDFGESIKYRTSGGSRNPLALIVERIPVTATLNVIAEILIFVVAIPVGFASARYQGRVFDRISSLFLLGLWSVPSILAATVLLGFLGKGGLGVHWFPIAGLHSFGYEKLSWGAYTGDLLWHVVLPVVCLVYGGLAYLAKMGRASLLENLRADYVRTARAKGLPERRVVYHHALRNSLLPMITTMVLTLPGLIGGSVIIESIFSIQGTGLLLVGASLAMDLALIMAETLLYGVLTLVFLLIGDICYAWADPRVRYE